MTQKEIKSFQATLGLLKGSLPQILREEGCEQAEPVTDEELLDLLEDRLSATEREDLIERLAVDPSGSERLADLMTGLELEEETSPEAPFAQILSSPLAALKSWLESCMTFLTPAVEAYSAQEPTTTDLVEYAREHNLYDLIDFDSLDDSFAQRAAEIMELRKAGLESAELLSIEAAVMEVHLVLSRDRSGSPEGFFRVWGSLQGEPEIERRAATSFDTASEGWNQAYLTIRRVYEKAANLEPMLCEAQVGMARIDLLLGNLEKAEEALRLAIALDPAEASAHHLLTRVIDLRTKKKG
jgi:tetratricopeptide (TPR) repeat protein